MPRRPLPSQSGLQKLITRKGGTGITRKWVYDKCRNVRAILVQSLLYTICGPDGPLSRSAGGIRRKTIIKRRVAESQGGSKGVSHYMHPITVECAFLLDAPGHVASTPRSRPALPMPASDVSLHSPLLQARTACAIPTIGGGRVSLGKSPPF